MMNRMTDEFLGLLRASMAWVFRVRRVTDAGSGVRRGAGEPSAGTAARQDRARRRAWALEGVRLRR